MSVINRIPNGDVSFHWEVELDCTDMQAISNPGIRLEIGVIGPYLSVENDNPIYFTNENDIQSPVNDTSTYNIIKNAPSNLFRHDNYMSVVAYPFKNWSVFAENYPYFNSSTLTSVYKFSNTPSLDDSGYEYTYRNIIGFYGHIVKTDEIRFLGFSNGKTVTYSWLSTDSGYLTTTQSSPEIMFSYVGKSNMHIIFEPDEIDKAWIAICYPNSHKMGGNFDIPSDWRYLDDIQRLCFDCTRYDPLVYQKQEPYKN